MRHAAQSADFSVTFSTEDSAPQLRKTALWMLLLLAAVSFGIVGCTSSASTSTNSTAPTISAASQSSGAPGTSITLTGTNFGATQGSSTVTFNGATAVVSSWSNTSIVAAVPVGATSGPIVVTVSGVASNVSVFVVPAVITSISQPLGAVGSSLTITGTGFGATQSTSAVAFNGTAAAIATWSATSIVVVVPAAATTGNVVVTVSGVASNGIVFTVGPGISLLTPAFGAVGATVTISGTNFGATQGVSTVTFNGIPAVPTVWSATSIVTTVPVGATTGNVVVTVGTQASNGPNFVVPAIITSLTPTSGVVSAAVTIAGVNFGATQGASTVAFNGVAAAVTTWSATAILVHVPAGANTGNVVVTVSGVASNGVVFTLAPAITSLSQISGAVGVPVTIAGTNFGATQGSSTLTFNGTLATSINSWSAASIVALVPVGATTGNVVVTVLANVSNGSPFTVVPPPAISSLSQASGAVGISLTITGTSFGATQGSSTVAFNGVPVTSYTSWSATSVVVIVPAGVTSGNVVVTVLGTASNGSPFTVILAPAITSLTPNMGNIGASVTIAGTGFGATQGASTVTFNATPVVSVTSWSATSIVVLVPTGSTSGNVVVTVLGAPSNNSPFTVGAAPAITSLSQTSGAIGASVTVNGTSFGATQGSSTVTFNGTAVSSVTSWSNTALVVVVPAGATNGNVVVTVGSQPSNGSPFTIVLAPVITSLSQTSGAVGVTVTIDGTSFGATQGASIVAFNGASATVTSWSATIVVVTVPAGATTGTVVVTVLGTASNSSAFTVVPVPAITSLSQTSGAIGASVTLTGTGFGASQGSSTLTFNGTAASITSWSATSIVTVVPASATTGNVVVTVFGSASNGSAFAIVAAPIITSLNPVTGAVGSSVTITGTTFGATQGSSTVTFNGTLAAVTSWSATSVVVTVPSDATSGNVVVKVLGTASAGSNFAITSSSSALCASGPTGSEGVLAGRWVVMMQGWQTNAPWPTATALSFAATGTGAFTDVTGGGVTGNTDSNNGANGGSSVSSANVLVAGSSYKLGLDPTNNAGYLGCMTLASSTGGAVSLRFALSVTSGAGVRGRIIQWTDTSGAGTGTRTSGVMLPQDATAFTNGNTSSLQPNYAFAMDGLDPSGLHYAIAGTFGINTATGVFTSSKYDDDDAGTGNSDSSFSNLAISGVNAQTGRGVMTITVPGPTTTHYAIYIANANEFFIVGTDPYSTASIVAGRAIVIAPSTVFTNSSIGGNYVEQVYASTFGDSTCNSGDNCASVTLGVIGVSNGTVTGGTLMNYGTGYVPVVSNPSGSYSIDSSGRLSLSAAFTPIAYLATPQSNTEQISAFLVGTDVGASSGTLVPGANANVSVASLAGNRIVGNIDPGDFTVQEITGVGQIAANGNVTGYQYDSAFTGLTENTLGGSPAPVLTISNSPQPGWGSVGGTSIAVTDGTRIWFFDPGTSHTAPASITVIEP